MDKKSKQGKDSDESSPTVQNAPWPWESGFDWSSINYFNFIIWGFIFLILAWCYGFPEGWAEEGSPAKAAQFGNLARPEKLAAKGMIVFLFGVYVISERLRELATKFDN